MHARRKVFTHKIFHANYSEKGETERESNREIDAMT